MATVLSKRMSLRAFENGYWYHTELVEFGKQLGLPAAHRMRKNELESAISAYLTTGRPPNTISSKPMKKGVKDLDRGLTLDLVIANYTSNRQTKGFIIREAQRKNPSAKEKSAIFSRISMRRKKMRRETPLWRPGKDSRKWTCPRRMHHGVAPVAADAGDKPRDHLVSVEKE